jgi:hypothetical protein
MPNDVRHISLEPLLNDVEQGDKTLKVKTVESVGAASHRSPITVNNVAQEITLSANKNTIEIHNSGNDNIYYGGSGVTSSNGIPLFSDYVKIFSNCKSTFSIYVVTATGETSTLRVVEYS